MDHSVKGIIAICGSGSERRCGRPDYSPLGAQSSKGPTLMCDVRHRHGPAGAHRCSDSAASGWARGAVNRAGCWYGTSTLGSDMYSLAHRDGRCLVDNGLVYLHEVAVAAGAATAAASQHT